MGSSIILIATRPTDHSLSPLRTARCLESGTEEIRLCSAAGLVCAFSIPVRALVLCAENLIPRFRRFLFQPFSNRNWRLRYGSALLWLCLSLPESLLKSFFMFEPFSDLIL
jgi:hypothetical protein